MKRIMLFLFIVGLSTLFVLLYVFYTQGYFTGEIIVFRALYFFMSYWLPTILYAFLFSISGLLFLLSFKELSYKLILFSSVGIFIDRISSILFYKNLTIYPQILYSNWAAQSIALIIEFLLPIIISIFAIRAVCLNEKTRTKYVPLFFFSVLAIINMLIIYLSKIYINDRFF